MKRNTIPALVLLGIALFGSLLVMGQSDSTKTFKPNGKAILTIFGNLHSQFTQTKNTGFELERAYLGYEANLSQHLSAKVVVDMGKSTDVNDLQRLVYLKNAYLTWNKNNFKLSAGMVGMQQFSVQEKAWGHRYLYKSLQDEYKFGSSADLGLVAEYKFAPFASADLTIVNGDGYKKVQLNPYFLYGLGLTFKPVKDLTLRLYGAYKDCDHTDSLLVGQENLTGFLSYKVGGITLGAEYAMLWNTKHVNGNHQQGVSAFVNVALPKKFELFARWDCLLSNDYPATMKEQVGILGCQYAPVKQVRVSPNVRVKAVPGEAVAVFGYLNMEVKF